MLKKLLPMIVVVLILIAGVGGYWVRPFIDLRFVDYPVIQPAALKAVAIYEYVAEILADYPAYQEDIELVALEYVDIDAKIKDAKLLESMDWRYEIVEELEAEFPRVRVINIRDKEETCIVELYFIDDWEETRSVEGLEARLEVTAKTVILMANRFPNHHLGIVWADVQEYGCLDRCVRATVSIAFDAEAEILVAWANLPQEELFSELQILVDVEEKVRLYINSMYMPWIYIQEELPRLSDDPAPWDQDWFYED
jgi:hypothetical protein